MLIDDKFLYISLPRCGSTSFHYSCILNKEITIKNLIRDIDIHNNSIDFTNIDESKIMNLISHSHDTIMDLRLKFGHNLPVISVFRDRHEAFFSLYKHVVYDSYRIGCQEFSNWFANITLDELFFFETNDLVNMTSRWDVINRFLIEKGFHKKYITTPKKQMLYFDNNLEDTLINSLNVLLTPKSFWHNNDSNIIWFNINNLSEMEAWISNITGKNFTLKHVNSHAYIKTKIELNDEFKNKYNSIYDYYDLPKVNKTLI